MKKMLITFYILNLFTISASSQHQKKPVTKKINFSFKPSWSEEFNYTGLPDTTKWNYETHMEVDYIRIYKMK